MIAEAIIDLVRQNWRCLTCGQEVSRSVDRDEKTRTPIIVFRCHGEMKSIAIPDTLRNQSAMREFAQMIASLELFPRREPPRRFLDPMALPPNFYADGLDFERWQMRQPESAFDMIRSRLLDWRPTCAVCRRPINETRCDYLDGVARVGFICHGSMELHELQCLPSMVTDIIECLTPFANERFQQQDQMRRPPRPAPLRESVIQPVRSYLEERPRIIHLED